jgi:hypothetical protein
MAFTETDRDALKTAIAKGVLKLRLGDEEVQYDSFAAMRARLRMIEDELAGTSAGSVNVTYPKTTRGL